VFPRIVSRYVTVDELVDIMGCLINIRSDAWLPKGDMVHTARSTTVTTFRVRRAYVVDKNPPIVKLPIICSIKARWVPRSSRQAVYLLIAWPKTAANVIGKIVPS
jgi:hypothetical protein